MPQTVKLATARELAAAGSVRETLLIGQCGGYTVRFKVGTGERVLATKEGSQRLFTGIDAAARVLRDIGIARYQVDASGLSPNVANPRRRPDRAAALRQTHEDAAYLAFLQGRAEAGRRDPVRYTDEQVNERMKALRAGRG
ncbi:hypothetical protein [Pseudoxanthomonas mexicana]|uniref:hypothetical protein n=1 Tax=Pseudoxanthomonas mexicana TaxID=128785 RepID=UPI00398B81B7